MDDKMLINPLQLVLRAAWMNVTGMAALAFIVISFVADTWASIPAHKQHFAFVVINASGAHFIFSLLFAWPSIIICRRLPYWSVATSLALGSASYIYSALILQHRGLADALLPQPWVSIFPLGQRMINLVQGPNLQAFYYLIPLCLAWIVAISLGLLLGSLEWRFTGAAMPARTSRKRSPQPRRRRRSGGAA